MRQLQLGRTMLETISVIAVIGVLSVTGIYMYKNAMNDVRADGIMKDVLARAAQKKGNEDLNRSGVGKQRVYTPEYKKKNGSEETKGRYGYSYDITRYGTKKKAGKDVEYVLIHTSPILSDVCNAIKSKFQVYNSKNNQGKIYCISKTDLASIDCPNAGDIMKSGCQDNVGLYFLITYE